MCKKRTVSVTEYSERDRDLVGPCTANNARLPYETHPTGPLYPLPLSTRSPGIRGRRRREVWEGIVRVLRS